MGYSAHFRGWAGVFLLAAASSALQASSIADQSLSLVFSTASGGAKYSGSESTLRAEKLDSDGWQGTADLVTNTKPGGEFKGPILLNLTNLDMTCVAEKRCEFFRFDFDMVLYFDDMPFEPGKTPLSIALNGAGPAGAFGFNVTSSFGWEYAYETEFKEGKYDIAVEDIFGKGEAAKEKSSIDIRGYFTVNGAELKDSVSLPHSLDFLIGEVAAEAAVEEETPEPGTFALAGAILIALAARKR